MTILLQDLRYGARMLRKAPAFSAVAVLTLALGIGANTAMFGVADALLFRPPSGVANPERLVQVQMQMPASPGEPAEMSRVLSYPDFTTLRDRATGFSAVAAFSTSSLTIGEGNEGQQVPAILASGGYFRLLGARPAAGRLLNATDDHENAPVSSVVLGWEFWKRRFGGDPSVIGSSLVINGHRFTVVGVAAEHFVGTDLSRTALWVPLGTAPLLGFDARMIRSRFASWLSIVARLAPAATQPQAQAAAQGAILSAADDGEAIPSEEGPISGGAPGGEVRVAIGGPEGGAPRAPRQLRLAPLVGRSGDAMPGPIGAGGQPVPVSLWFMAVTAAVLLIACANVANLLLARSASRAHEIAIRLSLGATAARLGRQLMTESLLLAVVGAAGGFVIALAGLAVLPRVVPLPPLPPMLDQRLLLFTALLTIATTIAFGLAPALRATRSDLQRTLARTGARTSAGRSAGRSALVVFQIAVSLVLLVSAGLFIRSLRNVKAIDTGFDVEHLAIAAVDLQGANFTREQASAFWLRALERARRIPGVRLAALGASMPFEMNIVMPVRIPGFEAADGQPRPAQIDFADARYFATLGIAIREGRAFQERDDAAATPVVIVNEAFVRRYLGGVSPVGRCIQTGRVGPQGPCFEVVGVAADARYASITERAGPMVYRVLAQRPPMAPPMTILHVRTVGDPGELAATLRRELQSLDPAVPFVSVRAMTGLIGPQLIPWELGTFIFTLFGVLGALLAAIGLYGVISFLVTQRTREIGVRIALGARARDVVRLVVGQAGWLVGAGLLFGIAGAIAASRLFSTMLYGISSLDPLVYVVMAIFLGAIALGAVYIPARRATRVDPLVALRSD